MEQYQRNWKDYYEILQVSRHAEAEVIASAYRRLAQKYHPDATSGAAASAKMVELNEAYEVLSNPVRRSEYDREFKRRQPLQGPAAYGNVSRSHTTPDTQTATKPRTDKPRAEVHPKVIRFSDALPYVANKQPFFVSNLGGPYSRVMISNPPEWIRITKTIPLQSRHKLPMQVNIEATGIQWGKTYSADITVRLDESEAKVRVELRMAKKPR